MKNKLYKVVLAATLAAAFVAPVITSIVPVYAVEEGKELIFEEDKKPFVTALWGKYSKYDGKLVYRLSEIEGKDFYVDSVDEVLSYGFKIVSEHVNERSETYFKFGYVGNAENSAVPLADTITEETIIVPDDPKYEITEEPIIGDYVISDETYEVVVDDIVISDETYEVVVDDIVVSDETYEVVVDDIVVSDETYEVVVDDIVISDETYEVVVDDIVISDETYEIVVDDIVVGNNDSEIVPLVEEGKELIWEDEDNSKENYGVGHCEDAKEIIWEEVWETKKPEANENASSEVVWEI